MLSELATTSLADINFLTTDRVCLVGYIKRGVIFASLPTKGENQGLWVAKTCKAQFKKYVTDNY